MYSVSRTKLGFIPDAIEVAGSLVPLNIRRNRRAKRMYLRYNPKDHGFDLTLPQRARLSDGVDFVTSKKDWIAETLMLMPGKRCFRPGMILPILGEKTQLKHDASLRAPFALKDGLLIIGGEREDFSARTEAACKKIVRHEISELAQLKAKSIHRRIGRVTLRDTKSRWGSCSSESNLMFSWRLIFAPYEVLDYVVSHEVAHLRYMDHSHRFWNTVELICPNYDVWKDWLHLHGKELYRFTSV